MYDRESPLLVLVLSIMLAIYLGFNIFEKPKITKTKRIVFAKIDPVEKTKDCCKNKKSLKWKKFCEKREPKVDLKKCPSK